MLVFLWMTSCQLEVLRSVVRELEHRFEITHTTVQVEVEGCERDDMYCVARKASARP